AAANDFEVMANVHDLVVGASDGVNTSNINVTLTELDVNEGPEIDDYSTTINDSIANGTNVYDVNEANTGNDTDVDGDILSYSFVLSNGTNSLVSEDGAFIINAQTGVISVNDTTKIDYDNASQINLIVETTDNDSLSDTALVTFNLNNVTANDDTPGSAYSVTTGAANAWNIPQSNGQNLMSISARKIDGSITTVNIEPGSNKLGVSGTPRTSGEVTEQIEYDSHSGKSEAIVIDFNGLVNQATFSVSNLFANENYGEQGVWKVYYNGQLVATDTFKNLSGDTGTFNINTGNIVFDQLVFEATETVRETDSGSALDDSSDYFLTNVTASGPAIMGTYIVSEDGVLTIGDITEGLLNNDLDSQGDTFTLTGVNGTSVADGEVILLPSGALLTIHSDGTYSYDTNNVYEALDAGELTTDTFTYTVTDQYGATDTATVTINIVGEADPSETYAEYTGNPQDDVINGTPSNDIIVSDQYEINIVDGQNYNIAFIVDTSGSVGTSQLNTMKAQLSSVFNTLKASTTGTHSGTVNILLVDFDSGLNSSISVNLADANALTILSAALTSMSSNGNTNYTAGFNAATDWFSTLTNGENLTYFVTDGYPNRNTNSTPDAFARLDALSEVEAIGIGNGINYNTLRYYDSDNTPVTGVNASNLASVILGTETQLLQGDDTVDGGAGNDIIFGDLTQFAGSNQQGYAALQIFIADKTGQNVADIDVKAVHEYIREHISEFNINNQYDGNDILNGGIGNDIIFGQGGDDVINGGEGNDVLIGGLGNDTLIGGLGNDTFVWSKGDTGIDTIKDFEVNHDTLHISDLLQNEQSGNLENYLDFSFNNGSTTISIDADNDGIVDQVIVLDGVDLSQEYGATDGVIINGLLNDGALVVDAATPAPSPATTFADINEENSVNIIP
ncbi:type I secretion C-terminal target domain-containing protein, partial [Shewanella sp. A14]